MTEGGDEDVVVFLGGGDIQFFKLFDKCTLICHKVTSNVI